MEDYYIFILILFFGMFVVYYIHPEPQIFYRKIRLENCKIDGNNKICIEE
jgi:hypothetical protein